MHSARQAALTLSRMPVSRAIPSHAVAILVDMIDPRLDPRSIGFPAPRSAEANELNQLLSRRTELVEKVDELERRQRSSHQDAAEASSALEQLERRSLAGARVTDTQRKQAEDALAKAREAEKEPWGERVRAAHQAVQDADQVVRAYVAEHLDTLLVELNEDGERAAAQVDASATDFLAAVEQRRAAEQRTAGLWSLVRPMKPNTIPPTRSDKAAVEVARLLDMGGETAPVLLVTHPVPA
jgi:hypothetical protein